MATKRIVVEVEVPDWMNEGEVEAYLRKALRKAQGPGGDGGHEGARTHPGSGGSVRRDQERGSKEDKAWT
ncbi:MAG: hypothetical protein GSR84_05200 [Desulfurococcales archaeon]|nr:hypothetical protein [Desulfurococcales archaeon]